MVILLKGYIKQYTLLDSCFHREKEHVPRVFVEEVLEGSVSSKEGRNIVFVL